MLPTDFEDHSHERPTVRKICAQMLRFGVDRVSLVRCETMEREPQIMVVMAGDGALRSLGPMIAETVRDVGLAKALPPEPDFAVHADSDMTGVFDQMITAKLRWMWLVLPPEEAGMPCPVCLSFFYGEDLCRRLAPELTARGCVTNLS